jgi:putative ABC transport system substrate-binding protein
MQFDQLKRREFITLLGGAAAAWPLAARAQQGERVRRIAVLMNLIEDDAEGQSRIAAFLQGMRELGWSADRNMRIDIRWAGNDDERHRRYAAELAALAPDVFLASASPAVMALQQVASTVPIVFVGVSDPVGAAFVDSMARPGGRITGFTQFEYGISAKWLEFLKEIAPRVTRVAVLRNPAIAAGSGQLGALQAVAPLLGVELRPVDVRNAEEIERAVGAFVRGTNDGLIVTGGGSAVHRKLIVSVAARRQLPAVYPYRYYAATGRSIPASSRLHRPHSQGRQAGRPAGRTSVQVPASCQSQDRKGAWSRNIRSFPAARR